jgi:hypothetical protein
LIRTLRKWGRLILTPTTMTDAHAKEDAFLVKLGYAKYWKAKKY